MTSFHRRSPVRRGHGRRPRHRLLFPHGRRCPRFPLGVPYSRAAPMGTPRHRPVPYDGIGRALRRSRDRMDVPRRHHAMTSSSLRSAPHSKSGFSSLIVFLSDCRSGSRSRRAPIPAPSRRRASLRVACIRMRRTVRCQAASRPRLRASTKAAKGAGSCRRGI